MRKSVAMFAAFILTVTVTVALALTLPLEKIVQAGCTSIGVELALESDVERLLSAGWYGDPTDGDERLYAPTCKV